MDLAVITTIKNLCHRYGLHPDPDSGQRFLINAQVLERIVTAANLSLLDTVLEIGPGLGTLTQALAPRARRVVAVEVDPKLAAAAKEILSPYKNVKIITGNYLKLPIQPLQLTTHNYKLIANLPYHITGRALRKILTQEPKPTIAVLMVQKEVAERITALPGDMSVLSVMCQLYAEPRIIATVPRENFWPEPEVDSAVVKLGLRTSAELTAKLAADHNPSYPPLTLRGGILAEDVMRLVKVGFASRRKTLVNNLRAVCKLPPPHPPPSLKLRWTSTLSPLGRGNCTFGIFRAIGLLEKCRAQELSVPQWISLAKMLKK